MSSSVRSVLRGKHLREPVLTLALVILGSLAACDTAPPAENIPPETSLAENVPAEGDTLFALRTMHWDGGDADGYVNRFEYRYTTVGMETGERRVTDWIETNEQSVTLSFRSEEHRNKQIFEVRAIDNHTVADPTPAKRTFFTRRTVPPETHIVAPESGASSLVLSQATDWWRGVKLIFTAHDQDGEVDEYAWAVDDGDWHWVNDTTQFIPPSAFAPLEGVHTIRVTSRDNTGITDPISDTVSIELLRPSFNKEILIIDETLEQQFPPTTNATDAVVDSFYMAIFDATETWDYAAQGMPPKEVLGQYKLLIWHADNRYASDPHQLPQHTDVIEEYLNVGGDFVMSGWRILKSFKPTQSFPQTFEDGSFINTYLHIVEADETSSGIGRFTGAAGVNGFPDVQVDSLKLDGFPYFGKLTSINTISERAGFTNVIYGYQGNSTEFRGAPVGLRYYGSSFQAIVLGFPIFFLQEEDAEQLANEILRNFDYR